MCRSAALALAVWIVLASGAATACSPRRPQDAQPTGLPSSEPSVAEVPVPVPDGRAFLFMSGEAGADRLVVWDLGRRRVHGEVELGEPWHRPYVSLAGDTLLLMYGDRIEVSAPVGTPLRVIWRAPDDVSPSRVALSRDGALVAIGTVARGDAYRENSSLLVVRVADGSLVASFGRELFDLLGAPPAPVAWREDGRTIDVRAYRQGGRHGPSGWVSLDGRYGLHGAWWWGSDPTGRYVVLGEPHGPACLSEFVVADREFRLIDTRAGTEVWTLRLRNELGIVRSVSPHGEVLMERHLAPAGKEERLCPQTAEPPTLAIWNGAAWEPVDEPLRVEASWQGWPEVRLECPEGAWWLWFQRCVTAEGPSPLYIDGTYAGEYRAVVPVGLLDPKPGRRSWLR